MIRMESATLALIHLEFTFIFMLWNDVQRHIHTSIVARVVKGRRTHAVKTDVSTTSKPASTNKCHKWNMVQSWQTGFVLSNWYFIEFLFRNSHHMDKREWRKKCPNLLSKNDDKKYFLRSNAYNAIPLTSLLFFSSSFVANILFSWHAVFFAKKQPFIFVGAWINCVRICILLWFLRCWIGSSVL